MSPPHSTSSVASASPDLGLPNAPCAVPADDVRWFRDEVQPHEAELRAYLHRKFPSLNDVDDVVQDSYLRLLKARLAGKLRSARGFLFTAARNNAFDVFRHRTAIPFEPLTEKTLSTVYAYEANGADSAQLRQELAFLTAALEDLPDRCRQILILRRIHGLSHQEIAQKLSISEHTIEKQVGIGLKKCVEFMKRHGVTKP